MVFLILNNPSPEPPCFDPSSIESSSSISLLSSPFSSSNSPMRSWASVNSSPECSGSDSSPDTSVSVASESTSSMSETSSSEESKIEERKIQSEKLKIISNKNISEIKKQIDENIKENNQTHLIIEFYDDLKVSDLRNIVDYAKKSFKREGVIVIGSKNDGKISYQVGVSEELSNSISANDIAQYASSISNGKGGGGRKDFAQSGGEIINESDQIKQIKLFIINKL